MAELAVVFGLVLLGLFVLLAAVLILRERRRAEGWAAEAARLGLTYAKGDPLGLAPTLGADDVDETVHGTLDGVPVAALTISRDVQSGPVHEVGGRSWQTWSVAVRDPAGECTVVEGVTGVRPIHSPTPARDLEALLRRAISAPRP